MILLTDEFVRSCRSTPFEVTYGDRDITIRRTRAQGAELEVVEGDVVIGYLTPYGSTERGAISARHHPGILPRVFRTLDDALDEIVR
ncbi:hypothetical protein [Microbacterium gilvum]|uniref:Uncharacterized protein n=1 Tax=Microbacterium gilvum TaxID=1336204 RepID=A0ABP8ZQX6_9MICO